MKTQKIVIGAALAIALGGGAAAQQSGSTTGDRSQPGSTTSSSQQGKNDMITLTGCLQSAQAGLGGNAGGATSSTSRSEDRFVLTNAKKGSSTSRTGSSTSSSGSTSAQSSGATTGSTYILEGKANELRDHLNQEVEVTGRLESSSTSGAGSTTSSASQRSGSSTSSTSIANAQRLQVESVRMVTSSCSR